MNIQLLVRSLATPSRLVGLTKRHAEVAALGDGATLHDLTLLLDEITAEIDKGTSTPSPGESRVERVTRARNERIFALAGQGLLDPEIASQLGVTPGTVRSVRRRAGVPGTPKPRETTGWREAIFDAHRRGLTNAEIAEETGYSQRTVEQQLYEAKIPANRLPPEPRAARKAG